MPKVPQLAVPFRVENGQVAEVEQGGREEVTACVLACLRTRLGSRIEEPEYGVTDITFKRQGRGSVSALLRAVEAAEPRVSLLSSVEFDGLVERVRVDIERSGP